MADPEQALETKVPEELQIGNPDVSPLRDGLSPAPPPPSAPSSPSCLSSAPHIPALAVSLFISMLAHFGVGAARSVFTGRGLWTSGRDMFLVGFGVAAAGYVIGEVMECMM